MHGVCKSCSSQQDAAWYLYDIGMPEHLSPSAQCPAAVSSRWVLRSLMGVETCQTLPF
jgi:hypothetical protein